MCGILTHMRLKAYGKINLGLDVVRKREDGYHEVRMVMQNVGIFDRLEFEKCEKGKIELTTNLSFLPTDQDNLIYKAAKLMIDTYKIEEGVKIHLEKHIPVSAGMAGGSSDAAATMVGINNLFKLGVSVKKLQELGVKLGADIPYCIMRGTALSEGIGEILTPIKPMVKCPIIVAKPAISVSTKYVYENLRANELEYHPDIDRMVEEIKNENLLGIAECMGNVLETVTCVKFPVIEQIKDNLKQNGALNALMSGSGPTVFALFDDEDKALFAYNELKKTGLAKNIFLTEPVNFE